METNSNSNEQDVGEKKQVQHRKTKAKLLAERELEELRWLLNHPGGRWFLWRLLEKCGLYETLSVYDPHTMAIKSGQRDIGLWVIGEIERANTKGYLLLMNESKDRDRNV